MVKPFRSDHLLFPALPLDLPADGVPGAVMPTTFRVPEFVGWQGTAWRQGERNTVGGL